MEQTSRVHHLMPRIQHPTLDAFQRILICVDITCFHRLNAQQQLEHIRCTSEEHPPVHFIGKESGLCTAKHKSINVEEQKICFKSTSLIQTKMAMQAHPKSQRDQKQYYHSELDKTKGLNQGFSDGGKV